MNRLVYVLLKNFWRLPWAYGKLCHYAKHTDKYTEEEKYGHIRYMFQKVITDGNIDMKVYGKDKLPKEDGFIIYANHQGLFDVIAIVASCERPLAAVLKKELCKIKFLQHVAECTKSFPIERDNMRQSLEVIQSVIKEVKNKRNYFIFPEGTRSKNKNKMLEFHSGSFKCATKTKCPIVPVALIDSYKVLDQKGCKPLTTQMYYLDPIYYDEYKDLNTVELAQMVHSRIEEVVEKYSADEE